MLAFNRFVDRIIKIVDSVISLFVFFVIAITIVSVFFRYFLNNPFSWAEEITLFGFAWFTFLGAGSAVRKRAVISLDIFYDMIPPHPRKIVKLFTTILSILAYCIVIYSGFGILQVVGTQYTVALKIPLSMAYISIPIGGIITIMALIANMFDSFMNIDVEMHSDSDEATIQDVLKSQADEPAAIESDNT